MTELNKSEKEENLTQRDLENLVHELRTHQIELKMQNEELKRTQNELEESRNRYSYLYNFAPISYFTFDRNGIIIRVNLTGANKLGIERGLLINTPFSFYIIKDFRDIFFQHLKKVFNTKIKQTCDWIKIIDKKSNQYDAQLESILVKDDGNEYMLSAMSDITSLKQSEKNLREVEKKLEIKIAEEKYKTLVENIQDGVFIIQDSKILFINEAFARICGYSVDEIIGMDYSKLVSPDDIDMVKNNYYLRLKGDNIPKEYEFRILRKDGNIAVVNMNVGLINYQGNVASIGTLKNITDRKKSEEAIRRSEEKFASVFRRSPAAMAIMSLKDYRMIDINDKWADLFGFSREEIIGKPATDLAIWKDRDKQGRVYNYLEKNGTFRNQDCELLKKSGETWSAIVSFENISVGGEPAILSSIVDVTERKRAEEELRESKQQIEQLKNFYENIIETITEGLWKIDTDAKTVFVNKQMADMLGYSKEEMLNIPFYNFVDESCREIAKNFFARRKLGLRDRYECKFIKKDGTPIWTVVSASPLCEPIGNRKQGDTPTSRRFVGAIGLLTDITERKYIEDKLKESEEKYRAIVEYSSDLIWTEDIEGRFTFCNKRAEKLVGYKLEEFKGKHFSDFIVKNDIQKVTGLFQNVLNGQSVEYEATFTNRFNKDITIAVNKAPIFFKGKVIGATAVGRDITQQKLDEEILKKAKEELERSNKELEQFAYIASHDLQEPLRTISSFTELLAANYKGKLDPDADDFLDYIISGSQRMQHMIDDLLTLSRVGTKVKEFKPTDIKSVIQQSLKNLSDLIEKNKPEIIIEDMPTICADEFQLVQLFQNLIDNAIKFRKDETLPRISISAKKEDNEWIFSIQDNGIGIDPKDFKKLFVIFQRLHSREKYHGTGIGLAICKKIVERHGGKIWVDSKPGEGSTFYFSIPMVAGSAGLHR